MIQITPTLAIDEGELQQQFIHASGPGGQNVNKVATGVELRFDVRASPSLGEGVRARLIALAGRRITRDGVLVIKANRFRTQERNRQDAIERLVDLLRKAAEPPRPRRPTKPTLASKRRRLDAKLRRGETKRLRRSTSRPDD